MNVKLHIDKTQYKNKPKENIGAIKNRLQSESSLVNITLEQFVTYIENGCTFSPAVVTGTRANDWQQQQIFAIDVDNNVDNLPIITEEEAVEICNAHNLPPVFCYPTFSDSEDKPKFRLVFVMDMVIADIKERQTIIDTLLLLLPQCDKACGNADRIPLPRYEDISVLNLDSDAWQNTLNFFNWLEPQHLNEFEDTDGWSGKLVGNMLRIAGIIHCIIYKAKAGNKYVNGKTIQHAIKISKYFLEHANYVFLHMNEDNTLSGAKYILRKLESPPESVLKKYNIFRLCRGKRFSKVEDTTQAINLLVEYGYLLPYTDTTPTGGRPTGDIYILNPKHFNSL